MDRMAGERIKRAHRCSGAHEPEARRGPGYSLDPHADGNEWADDRITVVGPDGRVIRRGLGQRCPGSHR